MNRQIIIGGDFATANRGLNSVLADRAFSDEVLTDFSNASFVIVNLESPVVTGDEKPIIKPGPALSTVPYTIEYLKKCNVSAVTLANNHFYDYGTKGVKNTIGLLEKYGISYVGGGGNNNVSKPLSIPDSNIIIFNYCESEFSVDHDFGSNKLDVIKCYYDIKDAVRQGKKVIIIIHGGTERYPLPTPRMKQTYRFMIDAGASAVINHHQHCFSGYEQYNNGLIFYGLGNLFFDRVTKIGLNSSDWNEGFYLKLNLDNTSNITNFEIIPYVQCADEDFQVKLLKYQEKDKFLERLNYINTIIEDDKSLENEFNKETLRKVNSYISYFTPYSNRILSKLFRKGFIPSFVTRKKLTSILNIMRCESHRDMCSEVIKNQINYNNE